MLGFFLGKYYARLSQEKKEKTNKTKERLLMSGFYQNPYVGGSLYGYNFQPFNYFDSYNPYRQQSEAGLNSIQQQNIQSPRPAFDFLPMMYQPMLPQNFSGGEPAPSFRPQTEEFYEQQALDQQIQTAKDAGMPYVENGIPFAGADGTAPPGYGWMNNAGRYSGIQDFRLVPNYQYGMGLRYPTQKPGTQSYGRGAPPR